MTRAATPARLLAQVLAAFDPRDVALAGLDALTDAGNNGARHMAAQLRGSRKAGRPRIDDSALLDEMKRLEAEGVPKHEIAGRVAKGDLKVAKRLRAKNRCR
jgi:hypothetical protein